MNYYDQQIQRGQQLYELMFKKQKKFREYLQQKVNKIQQTKLKTIKLTQKYFCDIKQKMDKYLIKQQKRILTSYQDNINMSVNCLNHNYLHNFQRNQKDSKKIFNTRKLSKEEYNQIQTYEKTRKSSWEDHNQLTIKLQVKKLIEEMLNAEININQTVKLIGQEIKAQLQKLVLPLGELLSKIPKLTKIHEHPSTILVNQSMTKHQLKTSKTSIKAAKKQSNRIKNPQSFSQKGKVFNMIQNLKNNDDEKVTQRLVNKQNIKQENVMNMNSAKQAYKVAKIKPLSIKQDQIMIKIQRFSHDKTIQSFDLANGKSLLHIYKRSIIEEMPQPENIQNHNQQDLGVNQRPNQTFLHEVFLNQKQLINQSAQIDFRYEKHCKIEFQSKPNRQYILILTYKIQTITQNQIEKKFKTYQFSIYNYRGDLMSKQILNGFRSLSTENVISLFQIKSSKQFFFIVLNNHVRRFSLKNILDKKTLIFGIQQKIINSQANKDKIIVFQARKMLIHIISHQLAILQTFSWTSFYPTQVLFNKFHTINMDPQNSIRIEHQSQRKLDFEQKTPQLRHQMTFILAKQNVSSLFYIQNGFHKRMKLQVSRREDSGKQKQPDIQQIQEIVEIYNGIYLILSVRKSQVKQKTDIFLLEISPEENEQQYEENVQQQTDDQTSQLNGKAFYLQTIRQQIVNAKFLKKQLYFELRSGKILPYSFS